MLALYLDYESSTDDLDRSEALKLSEFPLSEAEGGSWNTLICKKDGFNIISL